MGNKISLSQIAGVTFATVGPLHRIPLQSLIGDWEGNAWGDGEFPGFAAVSTIALLTYQATLAADPEIAEALTRAADELTRSLSGEIESFRSALESTPRASAA